jgi:hypothetical protein
LRVAACARGALFIVICHHLWCEYVASVPPFAVKAWARQFLQLPQRERGICC